MSRLRRWIVVVVMLYVGFIAVIAALQRQLLFFPARLPEAELSSQAAALGFEPWRSESGGIIGWSPRTPPDYRPAQHLIIFHGNAGHALHRADYALGMQRVQGPRPWKTWIFEYPGYGAREGTPGRSVFTEAARSALAELRKSHPAPMYLAGESIGCGVACDLAEEPDVAGLVLITPFTRLADVAQIHFPWLPVRMILRDRWDNEAALARFKGPAAVLIAGRDEVVSAQQSELLFEKIPGPKKAWRFPEATHNDVEIQSAEWAAEVSAFLLDPAHGAR